jgi:hypothetical protein
VSRSFRLLCTLECQRKFELEYLGDEAVLRGEDIKVDVPCCTNCNREAEVEQTNLALQLSQCLTVLSVFVGAEPLNVCIDVLCGRVTKRASSVRLYQNVAEVKGLGQDQTPMFWFNFCLGPLCDRGLVRTPPSFFDR